LLVASLAVGGVTMVLMDNENIAPTRTRTITSSQKRFIGILIMALTIIHQLKTETSFFAKSPRSSDKGNSTTTANVSDTAFEIIAATRNTNKNVSHQEARSVPKHSFSIQPTIIVQLSGELGNHLSKIAHGYGVQRMLEDKFGIKAKLVMRHQDHPKWQRTPPILQACYPNLADWNYEEANSEEFVIRKKQQEEWLTKEQQETLARINGIQVYHGDIITEEILLEAMNLFDSLLQSKTKPLIDQNATISLPFLTIDTFSVNFVVDKYYDEIRALFALNESACCPRIPPPTESVFVRSSSCLVTFLSVQSIFAIFNSQ
jgi:hypothetical protein